MGNQDEITCPGCGGSGTMTVKDTNDNDVTVTCTNCGGRGKIPKPPPSIEPCAQCGGSGEITIKASDGTPRIISCPGCAGQGEVEVIWEDFSRPGPETDTLNDPGYQ